MEAPDPTSPTVGNRALPGLLIFLIVMCTISFFVVMIRLYTRLYVKSTSGWDDILIIPAFVSRIFPPLIIETFASESSNCIHSKIDARPRMDDHRTCASV